MNLPLPPDPSDSLRQNAAIECLSWRADEFGLPEIKSHQQEDLRLAQPEAICVPIQAPTIKTVGCLLVDPKSASQSRVISRSSTARAKRKAARADNPTNSSKPADSRTRVRPPRDVVKLEDRLHFLLQPPLEDVFNGARLEFPFRPFPYQFAGIAFLFPRHEAVVADEMGLGKTMQTVVTLRLLAHQGLVRRALLVCPKPLVTNWQREFGLWAPELLVTVVNGKQARREFLWQSQSEGVMLANYELLVRDRELLDNIPEPFDLMVIDESQRIKNRLGTTNEVVCSVPRKRSWALTGTPIENSIEDLVGIFNFVSPGCLQPGMKASAVKRSVSDYVIRRTKDQVLTDLPPKMFRDAEIDLSPEQWGSYNRAENEGVVQLKELRTELTIQHVFELVLRLKQICNFDPATGASAKADRLEADLEECAASGRKAIVFSQWVHSIESMRERLARFNPLEYHGKVPSSKRDGVIDAFRDEPDRHVILMSYGAGSVGLNLQFAGYVFLFDRWWNPAVEDQAINRAHRIGAAGPVTVTRMLATGTIEERIDKVLQEKRELFDSVFDSSEQSPQRLGLSRDEIFGLFDLQFPSADAA